MKTYRYGPETSLRDGYGITAGLKSSGGSAAFLKEAIEFSEWPSGAVIDPAS